MARYEEPMDIDIDSEFDNKENSLHHSNMYQQMSCTEKGYEELDVSELNMKLRYSLTPVSSPMSKSYTANCVDIKSNDSNDDITNSYLTRSFNSTITRSQVLNKSVKPMPLQSIITDYSDDNSRNASNPIVAASAVQNNITVIISNIDEGNEEILSAPSSLSSLTPSPSVTTPTKELPRCHGGSLIMRALKTVLNMFRPSQSPIPPEEENLAKDLSPNTLPPVSPQGTRTVLASTPISAHRCKDGNISKCNNSDKESILFNEDLEKGLLWKDETTILFSKEKIPIHKLFLRQCHIIDSIKCDKNKEVTKEHLNSSLEYMDVSYDKTINDIIPDANNTESEGEFLDCETTYTDEEMQKGSSTIKDKDQQCTDVKKLLPKNKESSIGAGVTCGNVWKATYNKNITVRETDTEDEDTIEGQFFGAEDIETDEKMPVFDFDDDNLMQPTDLLTLDNERDIEGNGLFIDAEAFEFLLSKNQSNVVTSSSKESLFLEFDPLFARRVSNDGVLASLKNVQRKQFTHKKKTVAQQINTNFEKPGPSLNLTHDLKADSALEVTRDNFDTNFSTPIMPIHPANNTLEVTTDDLNITVSKPMMIVPPAVNSIVTLKTKPATPVNSNRRSITFTSPAIAVIDRLLSLSGNNSLLSEDSNMMQANRDQSEADIALTQLRELLVEKELHAYTLRSESKELKDRLSILESDMRMLRTDSEDRLKKINELTETLTEKTKNYKNMAAVVEEYERTIVSLIAETEQDKKRHNEERIKLMKERDEQTAHLASMEVSFWDIHIKYEKSKQIILSCKANDDTYKKSIKEFEENIAKMQSSYELLKQHATSKLNHANQESEKMNRAHHAEVLKLNAMIKRKDLNITSLEETLAQKTKANEELTAICDELINKVG